MPTRQSFFRALLSRLANVWRGALGAAVLGLAGTAAHALVASSLDEADRLASQVALHGRVRVIVGLKVDARAEGRLSREKVADQRAVIRKAQDTAISQLLDGPSTVHARFDTVPHFAAEVDASGLARLRASPLVRSLQEDAAVPPTLAQSNPLMKTPQVWASGRTGSGWAVAVLDTGVDKTHPFLAGKVVSEACYSSTTSQSVSLCPGGVGASTAAGAGMNCRTSIGGCTHGTHVAGIVAGLDAPDGSHGVAREAELIAIQVFSHFPASANVMSYVSDQIKGLERVLALKDTYRIAAVNMSLGGGQYGSSCDASNPAIKAAIDNLRSVGIATVVASGNSGYAQAIAAPACVSSAISVGASCDAGTDGGVCGTGTGGVASYSNIASFVSLLAPGSTIVSSVPGGGYAAFHGTSMAAPHVAGAWALLKQAQPGISVADGLSMLRTNGSLVDDTRAGGGVDGLSRMNLEFLAGETHALAVSRSGSGSGSVRSAPAGVNCGSDCGESYAAGTTVTLNATPATGSAFSGWSGACSGLGACTLTMSQAQGVVAGFTTVPMTLSIVKSGAGSGSVQSTAAGIACGSTCSATLNSGASVTLTATPASGSRFGGWTGACSGTAPTCTLAMTSARSVGASFVPITFTVGVRKAGTGAGTVAAPAVGLNCGTACSRSVAWGTAITLSATPAAGSFFSGWTGACSGIGACTLMVKSAATVGANFTRITHALETSVDGSGAGSIGSSPAGIACGSTCSRVFASGTVVRLTAQPAAGSRFSGWGGACSGTGACSVTMSEARHVSASFTRTHHTLAAAKDGTGAGTITSSNTPLSCGSRCSTLVPIGATASLAASPQAESIFSGWGGACSGTGACDVPMTGNLGVTASFVRTHHTLGIAKSGSGSVRSAPDGLDCGAACARSWPIDTVVALQATPASGHRFTGWQGACTGTGACSVRMDRAKSVTAVFVPITHALTVARSGSGVGSVVSAPSGISCGRFCSRSYNQGTVVTLRATVASGSRFTGWGGACSGTAMACSVTMTEARSVTAAFAKP